MMTVFPSRRLLCCFLAACMSFLLLCPAAALETDEQALLQTEPSVVSSTIPEEAIPPETTAPEQEETAPPETQAAYFSNAETPYTFSAPYSLYFGLLHAHTNLSDGLGSVEEAFSYASGVEGLDFFAVTDHSNSFDNAGSGSLTREGSAISAEWAAGKAAAATVTTEDFLGLFGFEMTWPEIRQLGHIISFGTPGWVSRDQDGFADDPDALAHYFEALATVPGSVSQFCHPGSLYGDFHRFRDYRASYDDSVQLLETLGEGSIGSYIQALDQYWHLAPTATQNNHNGNWGDKNDLRTVILAETLTEESLFKAIRAHRVYATEDADLHIYYELDGHPMGSVLSRADSPEISVSLYDPTDTGGCTLEVITEGGAILARTESEGNEDLVIPVPGGYRWYFLKITQADGDIAVTAPVWVEGLENMGIAAFTADTALPIQGQSLALKLTVYNEEAVDFPVSSAEIYLEDTLVCSMDTPGTAAARDSLTCSLPYTHPVSGTARLRAVVRGSVLGRERSYEAKLTLRFRPGETVTGLLIDGSHGSSGLDSLSHLKALAGDADMAVTVFSGDMPLGGELLLIPPPSKMPEDSFREDVALFLENGGSLILLGEPEATVFGNSLLEALGSTLRFRTDVIPEGISTTFHTASSWCAGLSESQFFRHPAGCALEPGSGTWLVKDRTGAVLLACEETGHGGSIFAAGSPFLLDTQMPRPQSLWELPSANQTILQAILGSGTAVLEALPISEVRRGNPGETFLVKGYAISGTSNSRTIFPDTLYIQDESGGIAVAGFQVPGIQIGTPMEIIGLLRLENGVPELEYLDHRLVQEPYHYFSPETIGCKKATDYASRGGELVQVEGTVTALTLTADRKGISRLEIKDFRGDTAVIEIEDTILSGSTGRNTLAKDIKKGRTVRAIGLLHINEAGETVLRVRDCDEVVYVPPKPDPTNPQTGDRRWQLPARAGGRCVTYLVRHRPRPLSSTPNSVR